MHNVCVRWSECLLNFEYMFRCAYVHTRTSTHPRQHASTHAQIHTGGMCMGVGGMGFNPDAGISRGEKEKKKKKIDIESERARER